MIGCLEPAEVDKVVDAVHVVLELPPENEDVLDSELVEDGVMDDEGDEEVELLEELVEG